MVKKDRFNIGGIVQASRAEQIYTMINIDEIEVIPKIQSRVIISQDVVNEYAELMQDNKEFPPIVVFEDKDDGTIRLADGWHRYYAAKQAGLKEIKATRLTGGVYEAILHSVGANAKHGLRRTNEDKRKSVLMLLELDGWADKTLREIAEQAGVSHTFVVAVKASLDETEEMQTVAKEDEIIENKTQIRNLKVTEDVFEDVNNLVVVTGKKQEVLIEEAIMYLKSIYIDE